MNVAILGAPGCVGRNLIKKLLESPQYKIVASYRKRQDSEALPHDRLTWRKSHDKPCSRRLLACANGKTR